MSPIISITRRIEFDSAHRVMEHEGKCKYLHGHRYVVEASFSADQLDALGRVIDFSVIKERLQCWIDENWDHNTILWDKDAPLGDQIALLTGREVFYLPYNPTAENLAFYLKQIICPALFPEKHLYCIRLRIYETPNCYAEL